MPGELYNMAWMTVASGPGTGTFTLDAAVDEYLSFADAGVPDGEVVEYSAFEVGVGREQGEGTYTSSGTTLTRATVHNSTNGGAKVSFGADVQVLISPSRLALTSAKLYPALVRPRDAGFSWDNQGGASATVNANGGIALHVPSTSSDQLRVRYKSATAPYTVTAAFIFNLLASNTLEAGLAFRQSSDGKIITFGIYNNATGIGGLVSRDWTASNNGPTNSNANFDMYNSSAPLWLRILDNNTNRIMSWSADGYTFIDFFSEANTTFLTANQVGFFVRNPAASYGATATLLSWQQT